MTSLSSKPALLLAFGMLAALMQADMSLAAATPATGIDAALSRTGSSNQSEPDFLPPDEAFRFNATADGPGKIRVTWGITDGYYLYRARIKASSDSDKAKLGELNLPTGETKIDEYFGKQEVYHHDIVGSIPVARTGASGGDLIVPLKVTYQGCATAGLCYPPITKTMSIVLPPAGGAATGSGSSATSGATADTASTGWADFFSLNHLIATLRAGNLFAVVLAFFAAGLVTSLTPCVLPMIPILSGIIVGDGEKVTRWRGFSLAFTYVQGTALTNALAGALFALVFKQAPQGFFQQPWIVALYATLFVALALAMFGAYTLQMPSAVQSWVSNISNRQKSGTYIGCFIMGALSMLIATACVAPGLVAALTVIGQTRQIGLGAAALYSMAMGMGVPLLVVGISAGELLPKAGPWMDTIKSLFGVVFLGLAIYFLQPLLPDAASMLLWSALAVIAGFWIFSLKARDGGPAPAAVRAPGLLTLVYGIILLIGVAAGSNDPLQPLGALRADTRGGGAGQSASAEGLAFDTIKSLDDLNKRVAAATAAGRPVMLDFYADWCASCKEMERYTFTDKPVQTALGNAVLLRADVTKNDAVDQELLHHFGIFGPPTIAFYGPNGEERSDLRVVGYMKAADFASQVRQAFSPNLSASRTAAPSGAP